jgi:hypothetical protein
MNDFVLTYYGNDLTGSTNVMEVLEWCGVPSVLFLEPPALSVSLKWETSAAHLMTVLQLKSSDTWHSVIQKLPAGMLVYAHLEQGKLTYQWTQY